MQQNVNKIINNLSDSFAIKQFKIDLNKVVGALNKSKSSNEIKTNKLILKKKLKKTIGSITKKQWYSEAKKTLNLIRKISQDLKKVFGKNSESKPIRKTNIKKISARSKPINNGKSKVKKTKIGVN